MFLHIWGTVATFRLVYEGCPHPDLNLIPYGGKLFDPQRFPVLEDRRLRGDTLREARHDEVRALKQENGRLKQLVADYALEVMALKKSLLGER